MVDLNSPQPGTSKTNVQQKALTINLDAAVFGTFAEIGAGQEVARHFFRVGGAAKTIAKTMSAYDMKISDAIYGKATRYVSRERIEAMLAHEYALLVERLSAGRGVSTNFFAFANTVTTMGFRGQPECHGWMGVRFQVKPLSAPNNVLIHVRMLDRDNLSQQEALGIAGVNLLFAALYLRDDLDQFVSTLLDDLGSHRIEVDMIEFSGPDLAAIDNRKACLKLVRKRLAGAIVFPPDGRILQASEVLYDRTLIVERGRYQPVTHVHVDMLQAARNYCSADISAGQDPLTLCEISLHSVGRTDELSDEQLLARAGMLMALGYTVLISDFSEFHRLVSFFRRYTKRRINLVSGVDVLLKLFDTQFYKNLEGGLLEGLGRLFREGVKVLLYPIRRDRYVELASRAGYSIDAQVDELPELVTASSVRVPEAVRELLSYLMNSQALGSLDCSNPDYLAIDSDRIMRLFREGNPAWEAAVPSAAARIMSQHAITI
jgi:hypothetical protein